MKKVYELVGSRVKYVYVKGDSLPEKAGIITVACNKETGHIGLAYHNPKDQFVKEIGRRIAVGRLDKKLSEGLTPELPPYPRYDDVMKYVQDLYNDNKLPKRFYKD